MNHHIIAAYMQVAATVGVGFAATRHSWPVVVAVWQILRRAQEAEGAGDRRPGRPKVGRNQPSAEGHKP